MSDEGFVNDFNEMGEFARKLYEEIQAGNLGVEDVLGMLTAEPYDITGNYRTALYALGQDELASNFEQVHLRQTKAAMTIGLKVPRGFDPKTRTEFEKECMATALVAVLKLGGLKAVRVGTRVFVHAGDCDGDCGVEHGVEIDPFGDQVMTFREELDIFLGETDEPTTTQQPPVRETGWHKWM